LAGALAALRGAAALVFFTTAFIMCTSFPRSVAFDWRVYAGEVTAVSHGTAVRSRRLLGAACSDHDEVTGNHADTVSTMFRHEGFTLSVSSGTGEFLWRLSSVVSAVQIGFGACSGPCGRPSCGRALVRPCPLLREWKETVQFPSVWCRWWDVPVSPLLSRERWFGASDRRCPARLQRCVRQLG
jgi:hypothetical protein